MSPAAAEKIRILFVEDAIDEALLVRTYLSQLQDYAVTHTQDGDHALQMLKEKEWDLLVSDLNLPGTDGFDVIRAARSLYPALPILAVTGYAQEHYWDQAFRSGADQVMVKPLEAGDFIARVQTMVRAHVQAARRNSIVVVEGLVGDGVMGCGGRIVQAVAEDTRVVVVPITNDPAVVGKPEIQADKLACSILGAELRLAPSSLDDDAARTAFVRRVVAEVRPTEVYVPAVDETHPSRIEASRIAVNVSAEAETILGYQTGTTGTHFAPAVFVDIAAQMVVKAEAVAAFQSLGAGRADLLPRMASAYAHYWGRYHDYSEVEAFEVIRGSPT